MPFVQFFTSRSPRIARFHSNAGQSAIGKRSRLSQSGTLNVTFTFHGRPSGQNEKRRPMAQNILIVDDDPVQRRLLDAAISRAGMTVVTAPGGQPALDLLHGP